MTEKEDFDTKEQVESTELDKVDKLIYESQNEYFIEIVSDYFVDSKSMKSEHLHYNKILGDDSVNISFITLKKIIDTYCTDTSEDIFMVMDQILDPTFIKFFEEEIATTLTKKALAFAVHAKRKKITKDDMNLAIKYLA